MVLAMVIALASESIIYGLDLGLELESPFLGLGLGLQGCIDNFLAFHSNSINNIIIN